MHGLSARCESSSPFLLKTLRNGVRRAFLAGSDVKHQKLPEQFEATMSCRIDRRVIGEDLVLLCISGRITSQHVDMVREVLEGEADALVIDLKNVSVVDREAVKLLACCETNGTELRNCP